MPEVHLPGHSGFCQVDNTNYPWRMQTVLSWYLKCLEWRHPTHPKQRRKWASWGLAWRRGVMTNSNRICLWVHKNVPELQLCWQCGMLRAGKMTHWALGLAIKTANLSSNSETHVVGRGERLSKADFRMDDGVRKLPCTNTNKWIGK